MTCSLLSVVQPVTATHPIPAGCEESLDFQCGGVAVRRSPAPGRSGVSTACPPIGSLVRPISMPRSGRTDGLRWSAAMPTWPRCSNRLLRAERLDIEVAYVPRRRTAATRVYRLPAGRRAARRSRSGSARRAPLIRDETGSVIVGQANWLPAVTQRAAAARRGDRRRQSAVRRRRGRRVHRADAVPARPAGQGARPRIAAPVDHRARGPAGQHRCRRGPRRRPGSPRGAPLDVLSQRRRLAAGQVVDPGQSAVGGGAVTKH